MSNFGAYLKTKQFRINLILALASVCMVILIAFFSLSFYTRHDSGIPVPKLKGMQIDQAMDLLKEQGFDYKIDSVYVLDHPAGSVVEQDPDATTYVKEGRTIYLTIVTRVPPNIILPDLESYTYREAAAIISNYGLKVGDTVYKPDIANRILEVKFGGMDIKAGTKLPKGSVLDLVIGNGTGPSEVDIPDLINQDFNEAKFALKGAGLTLGTITYEGTITDSTQTVVTAQSPMKTDSLTKVSIGTRINLTVSQGKKVDGGN
jgi:beta-lactam-binding protein with PASTA domain